MRKLNILFLLLLIGCSSSKVFYDYDKETNFTSYKSFNFFDDAGEGLNQLDIKRIKERITKQLEAKGVHYAEKPDIFINFFSKKRESENRNTIGIGIGGGRNIGFGISGGIPISEKKIVQSLTIDFVEASNNQLIWQGVIESEFNENYSPYQKEEYYTKTITKVLNKYPPK